MDQQTTYALLAAGAYWDIRVQRDNRAPIPPGWKVLDEFTVTASGSTSTFLGSGFSARVYQGPGSEIVISYAGTEFNLSASGFYNDFLSGNIPLAIGADGVQAHLAALVYQRVQAKFGASASISFTGHSLGGGLAGLMAVWFDRPAIVFDPAPFELSATTTLLTDLMISRGLKLAMPSVGRDLIDHGYNDPKFQNYVPSRDFSIRESRVTSYAIQGEVLESIPSVVPRIEASRTPKLVGAAPTLAAADKHSIDLLGAVMLNGAFETAATALPSALPLLFDASLYGPAPLGPKQNLLVKLMRGEVGIYDELTGAQITASTALLTKFTADLTQLTTTQGTAASASIQKALLVVAMEYYYFKDSPSTTALFTTSGGGVNFKWDDIGVESPSLKLKSPRLLSNAVWSLADEAGDVAEVRALTAEAWHVQSGSGAMNWTATGSLDEAALGGAQGDTLRGGTGRDLLIGLGGIDTLSGGDGSDILVGGAASDILDGGNNADRLYGGAGADAYRFDNVFGRDIIRDSDGQGTIIIDGATLTGGKKSSANIYVAAGITYSLVNGGSTNELVISEDGTANKITVQNWTNGQLGITLDETLAPVTPTTATYSGSTDNGGRDRLRLDNSVDPVELLGLEGNDLLAGGKADDKIDGGDGDDLLTGGLRVDHILGGDGADWIFGSGRGIADNIPQDPLPLPAGATPIINGYGWAVWVDEGPGPVDFSSWLQNKLSTTVTVTTTAEHQTVHGGGGDDSLSLIKLGTRFEGGWGNDILSGSGGNNTYVFRIGGGTDTITDTSPKTVPAGNTAASLAASGAGTDEPDVELTQDLAMTFQKWGVRSSALRTQAANDSALIERIAA